MLNLPTSLYIHIPWCIKKCPYCDFNSHEKSGILPEKAYIEALIEDFKADLTTFGEREIASIFIGGGTPSLLSAESYLLLFSRLQDLVSFAPHIEITLEANPGTVEQSRFDGYRETGINRLSLGVQSFNPAALKKIGRIHDEKEALKAVQIARKAGFDRINLDIMYALPSQTPDEALQDLKTAITLSPEHISWYQFTLEPNTYFYKHPPVLPHEDDLLKTEETGLQLLQQHGFNRYEISAFAREEQTCFHNLNYWTFGDYFGIGAGAHGKLSKDNLFRTQKYRQPQDYLDPNKSYLAEIKELTPKEIIFEWMLNAARLEAPIAYSLFTERTGLYFEILYPCLLEAEKQGFLRLSQTDWQVTPLGRQYTNDLQMIFL